MANVGNIHVPPRGLHDVFLPAYRETQVAASTTGAALAHWVVPFDAELVALHFNMTTAGSTHQIEDFDLKADGTSILSANIDALDTSDAAGTHRGTIGVGSGTYDVVPAKAQLSAGTILSLYITTPTTNCTVDDMAFCLVLRPVRP
jgi:hypothetical protein